MLVVGSSPFGDSAGSSCARGTRPRLAFLFAATSAAFVAGCLGETGIVIELTGDHAGLGSPDALDLTVQVEMAGADQPAVFDFDLAVSGLPLEFALAASDALEEGTAAISITATKDGIPIAAAATSAVLKKGVVQRIVLPLAPIACADDPFEALEQLYGYGPLDPFVGAYVPGTLCPSDSYDVFGLFVPASSAAWGIVQAAEPADLAVISLACSDGTFVGPGALAPGTLMTILPALEDRLCLFEISREPPEGERLIVYGLSAGLGADCGVDDPFGGDAEAVTVDAEGSIELGPRTGCLIGDHWVLNGLPTGSILRAEVIGAPRDWTYYLGIECFSEATSISAHAGPGIAYSRTDVLASPATQTCYLSVGAPLDEVFTVRVELADYDSCVDDDAEEIENSLGSIDLATTPADTLYTVCRPAMQMGDLDRFSLVTSPGTQVCFSLETDPLPAENDLTFEVMRNGLPVAIRTTVGGSWCECFGDPTAFGGPDASWSVGVRCDLRNGVTGAPLADDGCAGVYTFSAPTNGGGVMGDPRGALCGF